MKKYRTGLFCGFLLLLVCLLASPDAPAEISVIDDTGNPVALPGPARRIVSLAPHVTELLYAVGAGSRIVGAVEYSDYPEDAKRIPRVGSGFGFDMETIVAMQPDLIIAWQSGNPSWQVARLSSLGIPVFITEPRRLDDVAGLLERLGRLTGTEAVAAEVAGEFRGRRAQLQARYSERPRISVFYQVIDASLLTVNGQHLINDVIDLCGGRNVFSGLPALTPRVDVESVLQKNPDALLASGYAPLWPAWRERWRAWPAFSAAARGNLFFIPPDLIHRHSPRILQGAGQVCAALETARAAPDVTKLR
ncbi:ABC transporter substrate-binding protein [Sulfuricaulis limicola]|uniref:ABC transporter substrate-binding protein n=1 Tax=Sulfuricaulis limicola TaxID=1620215 RepID=A0A1B4XEU5_9GAMM|nr:ABC transporter substrate-binding protein [Sulfuricaulis limicola]